ALWNGVHWSSVGAGAPSVVGDLAVFDDGTGAELYACALASGPMARWNGSTWTNVPLPAGFAPYHLRVLDLGAGPRLVAGGNFTTNPFGGGVFERALHGGAWTQIGPRLTSTVTALALFDDGGGAKLYAGTDTGSDRVVVWRLD